MEHVLTERQTLILTSLIEAYIQEAEPVASRFLANIADLDVSPATVRNELAHLEELGFIRQPHTSAGRIPTELGYRYYLRHLHTGSTPLPKSDQRALRTPESPRSSERAVRALAKRLNELSGEMVVVAFDPEWGHYTGVSDLLQKPEFQSPSDVQSLSKIIDQFDQAVTELFKHQVNEPQVLMGSQNPLGREMTTILVRYTTPDDRPALLALVGPLRMNYARNVRLMEEVRLLLTDDTSP